MESPDDPADPPEPRTHRLNSDLIEHIDVTPDTVITLTNGQILRVLESADEVVERSVEFRRRILGRECNSPPLGKPPVE